MDQKREGSLDWHITVFHARGEFNLRVPHK